MSELLLTVFEAYFVLFTEFLPKAGYDFFFSIKITIINTEKRNILSNFGPNQKVFQFVILLFFVDENLSKLLVKNHRMSITQSFLFHFTLLNPFIASQLRGCINVVHNFKVASSNNIITSQHSSK